MVPRFALGLLIATIVVACSTDEEANRATTSSEAAPTTTGATRDVGSVGAGRLAIIDFSGNVAIVSPDGSERIDITEDAGDAAYTQPIWSPDSTQLAFGQITEGGFDVRIQELEGGNQTLVPMSNQPFYMYWSPDGERIGVLHNGARGLDFELIDVPGGTATVIDQGSPFYFSWSPGSDQVAIHEGADRFETIDRDGQREELGETDASYLVPQWLPQGILHVAADRLVIEGLDGRTVLAEVMEQVLFVANADGDLVAVQTVGQPAGRSVGLGEVGSVEHNAVSIVDTRTGEIAVVERRPAIGFWWSPDGDSLLILSTTDQAEFVTAKVWSAEGGLVEFSTYRPSFIQVRELFPFFPQYAQSMTFWAPDSSGFALAGEVDGEIGIWVQDVDASHPEKVADGVWVSWSG